MKRYVLGGGAAPGDGIFRYKLGFAPRGEVPFHVGSRIYDRVQYDNLIDARAMSETSQGSRWEPKAGFFPAYRS
jgi:hypothetical protein